jgi:hypothetical protein
MEEEVSTNINLPQVMSRYTQDAVILGRHEIHNREALGKACSTFEEIVAREPIVPPEDVPVRVPYVIDTEFFCEANGHKYVAILRNFEEDKKQSIYQQIALHVAESLRLNR